MDWTKSPIVPRTTLEAWHQYQGGVSGHNLIFDYSGYNRQIACAPGNSPVLIADVLHGNPGWYFNGSRTPLAYTGEFTSKHIFIVASYEDAVFPTYKGLLTGLFTADILVGAETTDRFYEYPYSDYQYRMSGVAFPADNQKAPVSQNVAVIEVVLDGGFNLDGIQVGQQRDLTDRKWKGYFFEQLIYSSVLNDEARISLYEYFAMRYFLWEKNSAGLNIYPFRNDIDGNKETPQQSVNFYDSPEGDRISEVLDDSKRLLELNFSVADQHEVKTMKRFHGEHYATALPCVFRDYRFNPSEDITGYIDSPYSLDGANNDFNYGFRFKEK